MSSQKSRSAQKPKSKGQFKMSLENEYSKERKVNDVIYDFIYHDELIWKFIDTPQFQRLRKLKKLECLEYVCPSATNSRFEHSVGAAYLAKLFITKLIKNNPKSYQGEDQKSVIRTITLAALLYGLGYAPFNHAFQTQIVTKVKKDNQWIQWNHEVASLAIFDNILEKRPQLKLQSTEIQRIKSLIKGKVQKPREWQFDLINNKKNGFDVDKLEGFRRDAFYLGSNLYVQNELLINQARIIMNQICYPEKYIEQVYNIFDTRYKFYKEYYFNSVSMGIEQMICDVLKLISDVFKFQKACSQIWSDPSAYLKLNDSIIDKVNLYIKHFPKLIDGYQDKFAQAKEILDRLKKRQIYKLVKELTYYIDPTAITINIEQTQKAEGSSQQYKANSKNQNKTKYTDIRVQELKQKLESDQIISEISKGSQGKISIQDVCLSKCDGGFGLTLINPLKQVGFMKKTQNKKIESVEKLGKRYDNIPIERSIKVYLKNKFKQHGMIALSLIKKFQNAFNLESENRIGKDKKLIYIYEGREMKTVLTTHQQNKSYMQEVERLENL